MCKSRYVKHKNVQLQMFSSLAGPQRFASSKRFVKKLREPWVRRRIVISVHVFADALELLDVVALSAATVVTMYVQGIALRWTSWKCSDRVLT